MTQHVLLNNVEHAGLRVAVGHGAEWGDDVMSALTFPAEFRDIQAHYPIVFARDGEGDFQPLALLGLERGRNLFLHERHWDAPYVPLSMRRQPFLIGRDGQNLMLHVDLDHPRVNAAGGQPVFREHGGTTELLEEARSVLLALHDGVAATPAFVQALLKHQLLESFALDIRLDGGGDSRLAGFHTIHEERLRELDGDALAELSRAGYLQPIYMVLASMVQLRGLIARCNRHHAERG